MNIGLDHDGTYTVDPYLWDLFIETAIARGHVVYCVTGRSGLMDKVVMREEVEVIYTGDDYKAQHLEKLGIHIDVWIDNEPGVIEPGRKLEH